MASSYDDSEERYEIPTHIDDPPMFYWWEMEEFVAALLPVGIGIVVGYLLIGILLGILSGYAVRTVKARSGRGVARHVLYWYLPSSLIFKLRRTPPSYLREWR